MQIYKIIIQKKAKNASFVPNRRNKERISVSKITDPIKKESEHCFNLFSSQFELLTYLDLQVGHSSYTKFEVLFNSIYLFKQSLHTNFWSPLQLHGQIIFDLSLKLS